MEEVLFSRATVDGFEQHIKRSLSIYDTDNFKIDENCQFEDKELIGEGSFSKVYKAYLEDEQMEVALKVLKLDPAREQRRSVLVNREMLISSKMNHNNIVKLIKICVHGEMHEDALRDVYTLVTELCITSLDHAIIKGLIKEDADRKCIMWHLLSGLAYMHGLHFMHRDLKPANLLISAEGILKIADFGLSRTCQPEYESQVYTRGIGSPAYKAPEMLFLRCIMVDVWTNSRLVRGGTPERVRQAVINLFGEINEETLPDRDPEFYDATKKYKPTRMRPIWENIGPRIQPNSALELIQKLLILNPAERLTADEALEHDFFPSSPNRSDNLLSVIRNI